MAISFSKYHPRSSQIHRASSHNAHTKYKRLRSVLPKRHGAKDTPRTPNVRDVPSTSRLKRGSAGVYGITYADTARRPMPQKGENTNPSSIQVHQKEGLGGWEDRKYSIRRSETVILSRIICRNLVTIRNPSQFKIQSYTSSSVLLFKYIHRNASLPTPALVRVFL